MLRTSLQNRASLLLLISVALQYMKFQHIPIKFQRYLKNSTDTEGDSGKEVLSFLPPLQGGQKSGSATQHCTQLVEIHI